jgi:chromosome segregation ATPase
MTGSNRLSRGSVRTALILSVCAALLLSLAGPVRADDYIFTDRNADAYVLTKNYVSYSTNATSDDILNLNGMFGGNYLWVRRAGKEFVIRDSHTIKDANRLFAALDEMQPEQAALQEARVQLEDDEEALDTEQADIESRLQALNGSDKSSAELAALENQLAGITVRRNALSDRAGELESRVSIFQTRVKSLELQIETSLWSLVDSALVSGLGEDSSRW